VTEETEKPGGGWRLLGVLLALALAFACAVMAVAMADIGGTEVCTELQDSGERLEPGEECFGEATVTFDGQIVDASGSTAQKTISLILGWPSAVLAGIAALLALYFAATGRQGRLVLQLTGAAIVLGGLSILIGSI
jgi:hypothetical protein